MIPLKTLCCYSFYDGLSPEQLQGIAAISDEITFEAGEMILREGELADTLYVVISGQVDIFIGAGPDGRRRIDIARIGEGDILGWSAVVTESRAASAQAATPTRLVATDGMALKALFDLDRDLAFKITWRIADVLSDRLSLMTQLLTQSFETAR